MPLSEQEQRLLEEMERSLYQNDADFVATVGGRSGRPNYRAIVLGVLLAIVGVGVLVAGVAFQQPIIGVVGFACMLAGVLIAIKPSKRPRTGHGRGSFGSGSSGPAGRGSNLGFMDKLGDRWDKRQDGQL